MNARPTKIAAALALAATLASVSNTSSACSPESYISDVCVMAINYAPQGYLLANGQSVPMRQYTTLYALMGGSYGELKPDGTFQLPDLRGRFVLGPGQRVDPQTKAAVGSSFTAGQSGGSEKATLSAANLPPLQGTIPVGVSSAPVGVNLSSVTGNPSTATLPELSFTSPASGLVLKASDTGGAVSTAGGNALGSANTPNLKLYVNAAPKVTMRAGSIGGTLSGAIPEAASPAALTGRAQVTVPARSATYTYSASFNGQSQPIAVMPPYLALNYYIAYLGLWPQRD